MSVNTPFTPAGAARAAGGGTGTGRPVIARHHGVNRAGVPVPPSGDQDMARALMWPLRSFLELGAYPEAVPCARLHARAVLWEWGLARAGDAELVVSEIVTNAIQASQGTGQPGVVRLWLFCDRWRVLILVWDSSPRSPAPAHQDAGQVREGGFGLMLVDAVSDQWSWYSVPGGKVVWALCTGKDGQQ